MSGGNVLHFVTLASLVLLAACKAPKKQTPVPAGVKVTEGDLDPPKAPDGQGGLSDSQGPSGVHRHGQR